MKQTNGKYLAVLLCAALAVPTLLLTPGCTDECTDAFDCRDTGGDGEEMVCQSGKCVAATTEPDAGTEADSGTEADAGTETDAGTTTDAGLTDAGTDTDAGVTDAGTTTLTFTTTMNAVQVASETSGSALTSTAASFSYDTGTQTVTVDVTLSAAPGVATAALFHAHAGADSNTPIGTLVVAADKITGTAILTSIQATALQNGNLYIEVSDATNALARGQIVSAGEKVYLAKLAPVVTDGGTTGSGAAGFILDAAGTPLHYAVTLAGLTGAVTASHVHNSNGNPVITTATPQVANDATTEGNVTVNNPGRTALNSGTAYFNVHTAQYPNGEVSGTIVSAF